MTIDYEISENALVQEDVEDIQHLLSILSPDSSAVINWSDLCGIMRNNFLFVTRCATTGRIIAMATLVCIRQPSGFMGRIEDVVTHELHQGRGVSDGLMCILKAKARSLRMQKLRLTYRAGCSKARQHYKKHGFSSRGATEKFELNL